VGTGKPLELETLSALGFPHRRVAAEGIKGKNPLRKLLALLRLPGGVLRAAAVIAEFGPDLVIGMGSYSAGPVVLAARLLRKRIALHEQNRLPGITNRFLSRFADRIYLSFEDTLSAFDPDKCRVTGNPVRRQLLEEAFATGTAPEPPGKKPFTVFVIGGSQGARAINGAVMDLVNLPGARGRFHFIHQTGASDEAAVREAYRRAGQTGTVQAFFRDMGRRYREADLVVCRAGASTVAELTAVGKPAIFIPFPFAADDHQRLNAAALAEAGAAELLPQSELSAERLLERIRRHAEDPRGLKEMAERAGGFGQPEAASAIVEDCRRLAGDPRPASAGGTAEGGEKARHVP